jgi:protein-L-isoaspartate(D-aspartate) O-methyltransferase
MRAGKVIVAAGGILFLLVGCGPAVATEVAVATPAGPMAETATTELTTETPVGTLGPVAETPVEPLPFPTPEATPTALPPPDPNLERRLYMVKTQMRARDITDEEVLAAMEAVARHEFVPPEFVGQAYEDHPLPIGYGQTISQPYIVALMTQLLKIKRDDKVLEIGTGSGYQAAILAQLTDEVYTVEIIRELAELAEERLMRLGYTNVRVRNADGYYGWEEFAPYDAIIVTAAPDHVPQPLVQQLKDGGCLVLPVGPPGGYQSLWQITREGDEVKSRNVTGVLFVPLTGDHSQERSEGGPEVP